MLLGVGRKNLAIFIVITGVVLDSTSRREAKRNRKGEMSRASRPENETKLFRRRLHAFF